MDAFLSPPKFLMNLVKLHRNIQNRFINDAKNSVKIQKGLERCRILHGIPHNFIIENQDDIHNPVNMNVSI
jgi:cell division ATPase FtsA